MLQNHERCYLKHFCRRHLCLPPPLCLPNGYKHLSSAVNKRLVIVNCMNLIELSVVS